MIIVVESPFLFQGILNQIRLLLSNGWAILSDRNKGKVLERRLSSHITFKAMVYPNGTVTIMIGCSKRPFKWYCRDDWIDLIGYCGSIHQVFRDSLSLSEPLIHTSESRLVSNTNTHWL